MTAIFGLGFAGIIPAYVLAVRELFPAHEAGWRVPVLLCLTAFGMASGGWFAGLLYDHFGYYAPAFAAGLIFNFVNLILVGTLVARRGGWFGPRLAYGSVMAQLENVQSATPDLIASAMLTIETRGEGFVEITRDATRAFCAMSRQVTACLLSFIRHTSASLVIQENADPDVQTDLVTALHRIAPANAGWVHDTEGPDDMPAHIKAMVNGVSLRVPVIAGKLALGTWQGIYVAEHRARPHRREVMLQFIGGRRVT